MNTKIYVLQISSVYCVSLARTLARQQGQITVMSVCDVSLSKDRELTLIMHHFSSLIQNYTTHNMKYCCITICTKCI